MLIDSDVLHRVLNHSARNLSTPVELYDDGSAACRVLQKYVRLDAIGLVTDGSVVGDSIDMLLQRLDTIEALDIS